MPLNFFRKRSGKGRGGEATEKPIKFSSSPCGKFCLDMVFLFGRSRLFGPKTMVLAGRVLEGEIRIGYVLRLPDGRMLRVKSLESRGRKVEKAIRGEPVGISVEGIGWKPSVEDLKPYEIPRIIGELRKSLEKKYSHLPKELAEKLVGEEVKKVLEKEIESKAILVYPPAPK